MTDEAAKVINLSICKMAESRGIRRGGTSLHKHLLIASVLTKARSAYIENLYFGDNEATTLTSLPSISTFSGQSPSLSFDMGNSSSLGEGEDSDIANNPVIIDPSFFVEIEGEIDLPSDILNCVEKLTTITGEEIHFLNGEQQTIDSTDLAQNAGEMILANLSSIGSSPPQDENPFLHLGAEVEVNSNQNDKSSNSLTPSTETRVLAGPILETKGIKRRRGWSLEEDHEYLNSNSSIVQEYDDHDEGYSEEKFGFEQFLPQELNDKLKKNGISITKNLTKRRRLSKSASDIASSNNSNGDGLTISKIENTRIESSSNFRTNLEIDDTEENDRENRDDEDLFLDEDDVWGSRSQRQFNDEGLSRNDRRVPSASSGSSGSGSDEEGDLNDGGCAMEVDQLTSLVQYISFNKQQQTSSSSPSCPPSSPSPSASSEGSFTTSGSGSSGLTRSMSTPDLCSVQKSREDVASSKANSEHHHIYGTSFSHHVLPVKV